MPKPRLTASPAPPLSPPSLLFAAMLLCVAVRDPYGYRYHLSRQRRLCELLPALGF